ncbi:hypothetical protein N665_0086s0024 [Sinapis alba]|nr:hypothetical protein N665_0086s0024 [Sinapis alba]
MPLEKSVERQSGRIPHNTDRRRRLGVPAPATTSLLQCRRRFMLYTPAPSRRRYAKQASKRQSTSTPASFQRLEEQESRDSTEQGRDKLVSEDFETTQHHNGLYSSFLPILLSILAYILIFYVLDVSPLSIFHDTKILFFISNALIFIIAADYSVFAERVNNDLYGEYTAAMRIDARDNARPENSGYEMSLAEVTMMKREKQEEAVREKEPPTRPYLLRKVSEVPEKTVQVVSETKLIERHEPLTDHMITSKGETCDARNLVRPKLYGRSKSDKARSERSHREIKHRRRSYDRSKSDDSSKWMVVHKWKKAHEEKWENVREESEEFAKMSNDELNRRVEDFIQRFNRDIKRQNF